VNERTGRLAATASALIVIGACSSGPAADVADKTGGETVVLTMATIDGEVQGGPAPQAFLDSLAASSGGRFKVDVTTSFGDGAADAESRLVQSIASGELDGGWPATRAFAAAGIEGLEAVEAPMMITSYAAAKELVGGPVADSVTAPLEGSGVVGLGLAVGDLRRPAAADAPLLGLEDWQGIRFRSFNSPTESAAIRALGAEPVNLYAGWREQIVAGSLRGVEVGAAGGPANNVTGNVVLWPKIFVFSVSQKRYDALSDEQRGWLQQAADSATKASIDWTWDESTQVAEMCGAGGRIVDSSAEQLAGLRTALHPVIVELGADPESGPLMAQIQGLAEKHPTVDVLEAPTSCQQPAEQPAEELVVPEHRSPFPDGVYRVEVTLDDVETAGLTNDGGLTGTWTFTVEDGTYRLTCQVLDLPDRDCGSSKGYEGPYEAGHLRGTGQTAYFAFDVELMSQFTGCSLPVSDAADSCYVLEPFSMTWQLDGEMLTFSDPSKWVETAYIIEPWQKID
jgi:TRAP-type C4-dicarboxylate transport system substrate-binding protein